ncbi:MAG TPA: proline--tRNA ligase [Actinomycetota bacterium]
MALPKQADDFPGWYQEVVKQAGLAEPSLARGSMVIKPYGYAIWEHYQRAMDDRIKATGHENFYFPLLIPAKLLEKEAQHVAGFAPEVAVVTHAGGVDLEEPLIVRPTSETIIWATYAKWVQSYRDLPLLYNQWANVVRWEMRPRVFLRTTEFLWQEGHTAHETREEAMAEALMILHDVYADVVERVLGIPVRKGRKTAAERFAGADETLTMEALMRDRKALQAGTSHFLGQNFSKAYGVQFQGRSGEMEYAWATSWGSSTRLVGGVIMTHGDDKGLRLPPAVAPYQVVIVPIYRTDEDRARVLEAAHAIKDSLTGTRVRIDDRDEHRPGYKFNEWELKGVPVRVELGPKDLEAGQVVLARRDTGEKETVSHGAAGERIVELLEQIQATLFEQARAFRDKHTFVPADFEEFKALLLEPGGFLEGDWCGSGECEAEIKAETKATIRYLPLEAEQVSGSCIHCGAAATERATWAVAY